MDAHRFNKNSQLKDKYMSAALAVMEEEFSKPLAQRQKLTHVWLAEKLGISKGLAFPLLLRLAGRKKLCQKFPAGPIYWTDWPHTEEELVRLNVPKETIPQSILFILASENMIKALPSCGIRILNDFGEETILVPGSGYGRGRCLRVAGSERNFNKLAKETGNYAYTTDIVVSNWQVKVHEPKSVINPALKDKLSSLKKHMPSD